MIRSYFEVRRRFSRGPAWLMAGWLLAVACPGYSPAAGIRGRSHRRRTIMRAASYS